MTITRNADGSLFLVDDTNTSRTQTVPPGSQSTQNAAIIAFFASVPMPPLTIDPSIIQYLAQQGIGDIGTYTLATLPDPTLTPRRTAWVTDLYVVGGRMVSEGGYWKAVRPLAAAPVPVGNLTLQPWYTPPTVILTGTLAVGATATVSLGMGSGFAVPSPGFKWRIVKPAGLLGTVSVVGAVTKSITGWADFEFDGSGFSQTASGGLL